MKFYISLLLTILFSCKQSLKNDYASEIDKVSFHQFLTHHKTRYEDFAKVVIIPNAGCSGCIGKAQAEFIKNYKKIDTLYIFTAIADLKIFRNMLPKDALTEKNVIIDTNSALTMIGFTSIYPSTIQETKDGNLVPINY